MQKRKKFLFLIFVFFCNSFILSEQELQLSESEKKLITDNDDVLYANIFCIKDLILPLYELFPENFKKNELQELFEALKNDAKIFEKNKTLKAIEIVIKEFENFSEDENLKNCLEFLNKYRQLVLNNDPEVVISNQTRQSPGRFSTLTVFNKSILKGNLTVQGITILKKRLRAEKDVRILDDLTVDGTISGHFSGVSGTSGTTGTTGTAGSGGTIGIVGTKGTTGQTGTTGATGNVAGTFFTSEFISITGCTGLTGSIVASINTSTNYTEFTNYIWSCTAGTGIGTQPIALLPDSSDGTTKYLNLNNKKVGPVQVKTNLGSFNLNPVNLQNAELLYSVDHWKVINEMPAWYVDTQQGSKLIGSGATGAAAQGRSVALSADGNTLAVGGNSDNSNVGAVWVFVRSGSTWTQQGNKLTGSDLVGAPQLGRSVALSGDGNTLAAGASNDNGNAGAVVIFVRSGTTWTQQGSKLVGTGAVGNAGQGTSVALSADGNTLAEGGSVDNAAQGAVWIFTRSGTTWTQQGSKLVGTGGVGVVGQGTSVALSADGNTLAEGGPGDNSLGSIWVFIRTGTTWTQQGNKFRGVGNVGGAAQGTSVALSADGNTLAEGGTSDNSSQGAVWIFTRSVTTWTQQGNKLVGVGNVGAANQGSSISLSANGNSLAVGGSIDNSSIGTTWIYTRQGSTWTQRGSKLIANDNVGASRQGLTVSFAAEGNSLAVGGFADDSSIGATWIYV